jgi:hypothetical protein
MALKRSKLARTKTLTRKGSLVHKPLKKARRKKIKPTTLTKADSLFSEKIRARDKHCLFPGCERTDQLTCSHYIGRTTKSTRFDEDNCITLCRTHHYWDKDIGWEFQKQRMGEKGCDWDGRYTLFMKARLGERRWNELMERSKESVSQAKSINAFMEIHYLSEIAKELDAKHY